MVEYPQCEFADDEDLDLEEVKAQKRGPSRVVSSLPVVDVYDRLSDTIGTVERIIPGPLSAPLSAAAGVAGGLWNNLRVQNENIPSVHQVVERIQTTVHLTGQLQEISEWGQVNASTLRSALESVFMTSLVEDADVMQEIMEQV